MKKNMHYNEQTLACVWLTTRCQEGHPCEIAGGDPYKGGGAILLGRNLFNMNGYQCLTALRCRITASVLPTKTAI